MEKTDLVETEVDVDTYSAYLPGILSIPKAARSLVVFAHGSGSSRLSPRNAQVAAVLHQSRIATLLFDLLTSDEDEKPDTRFDIDLLADRLTGAVGWVHKQEELEGVGLGFFGASTGAAAALQSSTRLPEIRAVVSRGGRPDLAGDYLSRVTAPTLLVVGGHDEEVLELNRQALEKLNLQRGKKKLVVVPGATHLFEEQGALEQVAGYARDWFLRFLG
jgi:putative phosphoribosyl transferase